MVFEMARSLRALHGFASSCLHVAPSIKRLAGSKSVAEAMSMGGADIRHGFSKVCHGGVLSMGMRSTKNCCKRTSAAQADAGERVTRGDETSSADC